MNYAIILLENSQKEPFLKFLNDFHSVFDKTWVVFSDLSIDGSPQAVDLINFFQNDSSFKTCDNLEVVQFEVDIDQTKTPLQFEAMAFFIGICDLIDAMTDDDRIFLFSYFDAYDSKKIKDTIETIQSNKPDAALIENVLNFSNSRFFRKDVLMLSRKSIDIEQILNAAELGKDLFIDYFSRSFQNIQILERQ